jgi:hypothetical protein
MHRAAVLLRGGRASSMVQTAPDDMLEAKRRKAIILIDQQLSTTFAYERYPLTRCATRRAIAASRNT